MVDPSITAPFLTSPSCCHALCFTAQLLYPKERAPSASFARRLGGTHSRYKRCGGKKMFVHQSRTESRTPTRPAHSLVTIMTELKWSKPKAKKSWWSMGKRIIKEKGNCSAEEIRRQKRSKISSLWRQKGPSSGTRVEWEETRRNDSGRRII